jgi:hypothetical protein
MDAVLTRLFGAGGAISLQHDGRGIEVRLENDPLDDMVMRIQAGLDAAVFMARVNR